MEELKINKIKNLLGELQTHFNAPILILFTDPQSTIGIDYTVEAIFRKQLEGLKAKLRVPINRKIPKIIVAVSSSGGKISCAINITKLINENVETFEVLILDIAFGAASLFAILSDQIYGDINSKLSSFPPFAIKIDGKFYCFSSVENELFSLQTDTDNKLYILDKLYRGIGPTLISQAFRDKRGILDIIKKRYCSSVEFGASIAAIENLFLARPNCLYDLTNIKIPGLDIVITDTKIHEISLGLIKSLKEFSLPYNETSFFLENPNERLLCFSKNYIVVGSKENGLHCYRGDVTVTSFGKTPETKSIQHSLPYNCVF